MMTVVLMVTRIALSGSGYAQEVEPLGRAEPNESESTSDASDKKSYVIPAAEIVGFDFALNRFSRRYVDREAFDVSWSSIRRNLKSGWVVDDDDFKTNQFLHPYQGSVYHTAARSSGLGFWTSAMYTFMGSALWEIAGETSRPSLNDQIATGIGGTFFGEALFRMANLTLERGNGVPHFWRAVGATTISPATGFNRAVFGTRFDPVFPGKEPALTTQWNFGTTVAEQRVESVPAPTGHEALAEFSMAYGLPGKADYTYHRPFDYFQFEFAATTSNIFENIMTRGLIVGTPYEIGGNYRAIWGLYGSYDYMAPQAFRVSTTAVAGVGYGAGGAHRDKNDRDYHYGLTPQALLATRLIFGNRASLDVTGRGYKITHLASTTNRGWENIVRADASVTVRLAGPQALTLKYLLARRNAHYPNIEESRQERGTLSVYYTLVGEKRLSVVDGQSRR
jgi:hypothetical protein